MLHDDLVASFLSSLKILVLFFVEEAILVGVEALLLLDVHAHRDEEAEEADEGDDESKDLPSEVITSVSINSASSRVDSDVSSEVPHHEGPEAPRNEVLDREGPPANENVEPPLVLVVSVLIVSLSDLESEVISSVEEDSLSPLLSGVVGRLDGIRDDPGDDHEHPEDENTIALEAASVLVSSHGENGNGSHNDGTNPVDSGDDHSRVLALISEDVASLEEPSSSSTLSHTKDEHEVHRDVAINNIEVGESPRGAEEERSEPSKNADNQGSQLSGDELASFSVIDDSGDGFDQRESSVNTEQEQGKSKDHNPEVRAR